MKKKILSLVLALLMAASSASAILADDVAIDDEAAGVEATAAIDDEVVAGQYDNAIKFLNQYGIFKGKSADNLGAEDMLERYQMALFVARIATGWVDDEKWEDGPENWSEFTDISEGPVANYWGALSYANSQGIIEGYGNGKFGPTDGITYQNALTMVVRTLGYQGLEWPWGYIQKAVELGLTDGITGITYQDELNRGEVAQIIYNALFATTKSGSTLAMKSFGIEFGWEKVVITASDLDIFTKDNAKAAPEAIAKKTNGYKGFKDSNKTSTGYLSFKILNDDGSLGDDTYYMLASDIGLSTVAEAHDDEAVVGDAYYMLFEKDEDSNLVKTVAYESLLVDTLKNEGKTDDDGDAQEYPIKEFLKDYQLVSKYTGKNYVNVTASGKKELLVYTSFSTISEWVEVGGNWLAIDWETGDILVPVLDEKKDNKDGKIEKSEIAVDENGDYIYEVAWYYNELLDKYYKIDTNIDVEDIEEDDDYVYGIDYMSDAEFEKTYKDNLKFDKKDFYGYKLIEKVDADSAYAELKVYDTNLDGVADRALYEDYRLGYFSEGTKDCGHKQLKYYKIENVDAWKALSNSYKNIDKELVVPATVDNFVEGEDCGKKEHADRVWFVEGYTPVEAYDEDGEFTGYKSGYVIYNYDAETGAIKVVKNIDGNDVDTYTAKGVLRAYNLKNGTITIGEDKYKIFNYNELKGNAFAWVDKNWKTRAAYSELLRDLFNQYVEIVVVDGELVNVKPVGRTKSEAIVVDSYAGLSSDDYIVVNGYSTDDLKYDQFRIGSYDGWEKGDYYYYLTDKKAAESFKKGTIYAIRSYDEDEDVYYVNLSGAWNEKGDDYVVESDVNTYKATIKAQDDGYMEYTNNKGEKKYRKMTSTDKYVVIPSNADSNKPYAPLFVYEGKLPANAEIKGTRINSDAHDTTTYVIVNATVTGVELDSYKTGLVLLLNKAYISADYNGADAEDWYLLGASKFDVEVFDVLAGKYEVVKTATNVSLKEGHIYFTQDGVIVEDLGVLKVAGIPAYMGDCYPINGICDDENAHYAYGSFEVTDANYADIFSKSKVSAMKDSGKSLIERLAIKKYYDGTIDELLIFAITYEDDVVDTKSFTRVEKAKDLEKLMEEYDGYTLYANWVYGISSKDMVVYIDITEGEGSRTTISDLDYTNPVKVWTTKIPDAEAYISAQFGYTTKTVNVNGVKTTTATIETVLLTFGGYDVEKATHDIISNNGWYFGLEGSCTWESIVSRLTINGDSCYPVRESIVEDIYDCDNCKLVKSVEIPVTFAKTVDGKISITEGYIMADDDEPATVTITLTDTDLDDLWCGFPFGEETLEEVSVDLWTNVQAGYKVSDGWTEFTPKNGVYAFVD